MISRIGSPRYAVSGHSGQEKPTLDAGSSRWYIAECKPTRERTLRSSLEKVGYEAYVASRKEIHVYKSRNRRTVEQIVIPGKVFVRTERANLMNILLLFSSVYRFQIDKSAASPTSGEPPYAYVTESEMRRLQHLLVESANPAIVFVVMACINIGLAIPMTRYYGVVGLSVSICIAYFVRTVGLNIIYYKSLHIDILKFFKESFLRMAFPLILTFVVGFLVQRYVLMVGWTGFIVKGIGLSVLYCVIMLLVAMNADERRLILAPFKKLNS